MAENRAMETEATSAAGDKTHAAAKRRRNTGTPEQELAGTPEQERARTPELTSETALLALMLELKEMREDRERTRRQFEETLRLRDIEFLRMQTQISRSSNIPCEINEQGASERSAVFTFGQARATGDTGSVFERARNAGVSVCAGRAVCGDSDGTLRVMGAGADACAERASRGLKLKPDIFDGTAPLREFLAQFLLIARANFWTESEKAVVLASCLRGKARSLLESCADEIESLTFAELTEKLELRFGEGHLSQNYYSLFTNRKQKFGEDFAALGSDLERLSRLAYPECVYAVQDKIACSQFVSALTDGLVKRTLQLEGITSLKVAIERAKAVKAIQGESSTGNGKFSFENKEKGKSFAEMHEEKGDVKEGENIEKGNKKYKAKECWICGKTGHFRSECPEKN